MHENPRHGDDYEPRQVAAAKRVIVDVMQVLASHAEYLVLVGGWVPDLAIKGAEEKHVGSIDVDLALDAAKLNGGRYAEILKLLLNTRRYRQGEKDFQFVAEVDLNDGEPPVRVEVDFLAPPEVKTDRRKPKLIPGFRVQKADGCSAVFREPLTVELSGRMIGGAQNTVRLQVASVPGFLIMKCHALNGRDKPKDAYDICYCLDHFAGGISELAEIWSRRIPQDPDVVLAVKILREKFAAVDAYGPMQVVEFYDDMDPATRDERARRAFELVQAFLSFAGD